MKLFSSKKRGEQLRKETITPEQLLDEQLQQESDTLHSLSERLEGVLGPVQEKLRNGTFQLDAGYKDYLNECAEIQQLMYQSMAKYSGLKAQKLGTA